MKEKTVSTKPVRILKTIFKWLLGLVAFLLILFILIAVALQFPSVQTYITGKIVETVSQRTGTPMAVDRVFIRFPKAVGLEGIYVEDTRGDTLLYAGSIAVDVNLLALLRNRIQVSSLELENVHANMLRLEPDTVFNYQFIVDAFAGNDNQQNNGAEPESPSEENGGPAFDIDRVSLKDIRFRFADHKGGMDLSVNLGGFNTRITRFDPGEFIYHVDNTTIRDALVEMHMSEPTVEREAPEPAETPDMDLMVQRLSLENVGFAMSTPDGMRMTAYAPELSAQPRRLNLNRNLVELDHLRGDGLEFEMETPPSPPRSGEPVTAETQMEFRWDEIFEWDIQVDELRLKNASVAMKTLGRTSTTAYFDPEHMEFSGIALDANNLVVNPATIQMNLRNLQANHPSGFALQRFTAGIDLGPELSLRDLRLETRQSTLRLDLQSPLNPLQITEAALEQASVNLHVREGQLARDLHFFFPPLEDYFEMAGDPAYLQLAMHLHGDMGDMLLDHFSLHAQGLLLLDLQGNIRGLPNIEELWLELPEIKLEAAPKRLLASLPDTISPEGLEMPDTLNLDGRFTGGMNAFDTRLVIASTFGNINLEAYLTEENDAPQSYQVMLELTEVQPGKLLNQPALGPVTASLSLSGAGLDPETAEAAFELLVEKAVFNDYEYDGLESEGTLSDGRLSMWLEYDDSNLGIYAENDVLFSGEYPHVVINWEIVQANLLELNLTDELVLLRGEITGDMDVVAADFAVGTVQIRDLYAFYDDLVYTLGRLELETSLEDGRYLLHLESPVLQASYSGNISPVQVPEALGSHLNRYMDVPMQGHDENGQARNFDVEVTLPPSDWLTELLLPDLTLPTPFVLNASFNSDTRILALESELNEMSFGGMRLRNMALNAATDPEEGSFSLKFENFDLDNLNLTNVSFEGQFRDSLLNFTLAFDDQERQSWLSMSGNLQSYHNGWELSLDEEILINRDTWQVTPGNYLRFGPQMLLANNLRLQRNEKYLLVQSQFDEQDQHQDEDGGEVEHEQEATGQPPGANPPLNITFNEVDLGEFSILEEKPLAGGVFNGFITLQDIFTSPGFTADLAVSNFAFRGDTLGDINLLASNPGPDLFALEATVRGFGNEITVAGTYQTGDNAALDIDVRLVEVNLATLEGILEGDLSDLDGRITGELKVQGEPANPTFDGSLSFRDARFHVEFLNAMYTIRDETIRFDRSSIRFSNFTLRDPQNRTASLDGSINMRDLSDIRFSLDFTSSNFLMLNVPEGDNDLFHGRLLVDCNLRLRGDMAAPVVDGRLRLNEGSNFTFIVPTPSPEAIGAEGVVTFISPLDTIFEGLIPEVPATPAIAAFQNLDLGVSVEIDRQSEVRIIIDPYAGDYLEVTGGGMLSLGIDPGGRISLAGRYDIVSGSYLLTFYDVIRRSFSIQSGSSIQWRGDPMDAIVDITAIYTIRTTARELLASQVQGGGGDLAAMRQQFPFRVHLKMEGDLLQPDISFDINLPPEHQDALDGRVQSRLNELSQDESELNKQVFALLVLGNFLPDNPFDAVGAGPGLEATARSSASRILSQQLNRLADRYVRGVDITFDIESYEDFTTGVPEGRTELQMEVSRDFFDERVRITVGGNIELEDDARRETSPGEIAGDFLMEYLLNPEGTLVMKAFRKKHFGDVFDGQVWETGVSLLFTRSYNAFRELFMRKEESPAVPDAGGNDETETGENQ
jgi:translocation and assembly module TamB